MVRGPLPGERLFIWPRSDSIRRLFRFAALVGAALWFIFPPMVFADFLPHAPSALVAVPLWFLMFLTWIAGFILLGRSARGLAPLRAGNTLGVG